MQVLSFTDYSDAVTERVSWRQGALLPLVGFARKCCCCGGGGDQGTVPQGVGGGGSSGDGFQVGNNGGWCRVAAGGGNGGMVWQSEDSRLAAELRDVAPISRAGGNGGDGSGCVGEGGRGAGEVALLGGPCMRGGEGGASGDEGRSGRGRGMWDRIGGGGREKRRAALDGAVQQEGVVTVEDMLRALIDDAGAEEGV